MFRRGQESLNLHWLVVSENGAVQEKRLKGAADDVQPGIHLIQNRQVSPATLVGNDVKTKKELCHENQIAEPRWAPRRRQADEFYTQ